MSTYDTTTDGLSIDTTPTQDRGLVQGLMVGGRALSMVLTAALMGVFSQPGKLECDLLDDRRPGHVDAGTGIPG